MTTWCLRRQATVCGGGGGGGEKKVTNLEARAGQGS